MRCKHVKLKLDRYIHGDLPDTVSENIKMHVSNCWDCADALSRMRKLEGLLKDTSLPPVPEGFSERLMQRVRQRQPFQKASEPKIIRLWEWFGRAGLQKTGVAVGIVIGLSIGLLMGLDINKQSAGQRLASSQSGYTEMVKSYKIDYLSGTPHSSLSGTFLRLVQASNSDEE